MSLVLWPVPGAGIQPDAGSTLIWPPLGHVGDWLLDLTTDVEQDTAQALVVEADVGLIAATEADSAVALVVTKTETLIADSEADAANALVLETDVSLVADSETDSANAISVVKTEALTAVAEADTANASTEQKQATLTAKSEADVAGALTATQPFTSVTLTTVAEADTAGPLAESDTPELVSGAEADTAGGLSYGIQQTAIQATDLSWAASSNTTSLGGAINGNLTTNVANNLWDDVTSDESGTGDVEYRCVYVRNNHPTKTWMNVVVWIDAPPATGSADLALDSAALGATATSAATDENTAPAPALSFSPSTTRDTALPIGNVPAGSYKAVWLRRTIPPGAGGGDDVISIRAEGGTP